MADVAFMFDRCGSTVWSHDHEQGRHHGEETERQRHHCTEDVRFLSFKVFRQHAGGHAIGGRTERQHQREREQSNPVPPIVTREGPKREVEVKRGHERPQEGVRDHHLIWKFEPFVMAADEEHGSCKITSPHEGEECEHSTGSERNQKKGQDAVAWAVLFVQLDLELNRYVRLLNRHNVIPLLLLLMHAMLDHQVW